MTASRELRIRLARNPLPVPHRAVFRILVTEAWKRRDAKGLEDLGVYAVAPDPKDGRKHVSLNFDRTKYWLGKGAQPSKRCLWLLSKVSHHYTHISK